MDDGLSELMGMMDRTQMTSQEVLMSKFKAVTGVQDDDTARFWLGSSAGILDRAVNMYFQSGGKRMVGTVGARVEAQLVAVKVITPDTTEGVPRGKDGEFIVPARIPFKIAWAFKNTGTMPWPRDAVLMYVEGAQFQGRAKRIPITAAPVGETVVVESGVLMAEELGSQISRWQLWHPAGYISPEKSSWFAFQVVAPAGFAGPGPSPASAFGAAQAQGGAMGPSQGFGATPPVPPSDQGPAAMDEL